MTGLSSSGPMRLWLVAAGLLVLGGLTLIIRALGFEYVFIGDDIVFPPADPQYHLRRALFTMTRFPDVLLFDPYINFPGGAAVPWPPLFDVSLGAAAWMAGGTVGNLEQIAAWSSPACAVLTLWPIYLLGVRLSSPRLGLLAGFFFALLPISVVYTRVGNADHHSAVSMIGAWLLYCLVAWVDPNASRRRFGGLVVLLALVSSAMLLTWHGSLLYLAPAEAILLLAGILTGRSRLLAGQAISALATACMVMVWLTVSPTPLGGPYSSIALSRLHWVAMLAVTATAGTLWLALRRGWATTVQQRFIWSGLGVGLFLFVLMGLPGPRAGLTYAYQFLTLSDEVGSSTGEQTPLFSLGVLGDRLQGPPASQSWGFFAYLLPVIPLAGLLAGRGRTALANGRPAGWVLLGWGAFFCTLAFAQRRYGNDAAPAAALLFALLISAVADGVIQILLPGFDSKSRSRGAAGVAVLLILVGFWPAFRTVYQPRALASWSAWSNPAEARVATSSSIAHTLHRFAGQVRDWTPPTSGFTASAKAPEYGVIAHPNLGHALQYRARRATATDPFWWYIGRPNWDRTQAFLNAKDEPQAIALAQALSARYLVTMPGLPPGSVAARLHHIDGQEQGGLSTLGHFRLIGEAPRGGQSIGALFEASAPAEIPYKLFEIVPGAVIEVPAPSGARVVARLPIQTATGRRFLHQVSARAGPEGVARLRVPYATSSEDLAEPRGAWTQGHYQVRGGSESLLPVEVSEEDVRSGRTVQVSPTPRPRS